MRQQFGFNNFDGMVENMIPITITGGTPWGFRMRGGYEFSLPISIESVSPGGLASKSGLLPGDVIISVNGVSLDKKSHQEAKNVIVGKETLVLMISRSSDKSGSKASLSEKEKPAYVPPVSNYAQSSPKASQTIHKGTYVLDDTPSTPTTNTSGYTSAYSSAGAQNAKAAPVPVQATAASYTVAKSQLTEPTIPVTTTSPQKSEPSSSASPAASNASKSVPTTTPAFSVPVAETIKTDQVSSQNVYGSTRPEGIRICEKCGQAIESKNVVTLDKRFWHNDHFRCSDCNESLVSVGFYEDGNKIMCKNCYSKSKAPKCAACNEGCVAEYLSAAGQTFHPACFKCAKCLKNLRGQPFTIHSNVPHCVDCANEIVSHRCDKCQKFILPGQEYIEALGQKLHRECFTCFICGVSLVEKSRYVLRDNKPCCPDHKRD